MADSRLNERLTALALPPESGGVSDLSSRVHRRKETNTDVDCFVVSADSSIKIRKRTCDSLSLTEERGREARVDKLLSLAQFLVGS